MDGFGELRLSQPIKLGAAGNGFRDRELRSDYRQVIERLLRRLENPDIPEDVWRGLLVRSAFVRACHHRCRMP